MEFIGRSEIHPIKSESDKKDYRIIKLNNGIKCILVSDPSPVPDSSSSEGSESDEESSCNEISSMESTDSEFETDCESSEDSDDEDEGDRKLAACALMVDVGSFSDPRDIQGLAHFLEHMIFMGSEKYPLENAFDSHIKKSGGYDNADTKCEETSFYFEVPEEELSSSMEMFAELFIAPLMKIEAITREREAVESEFQSIIQEDEERRDALISSLGCASHPCNTFPWGNLETLKDNIDIETLHRRLHQFRDNYYTADRMYLAVQARLPLDAIEEMVEKHFSRIKSSENPIETFVNFNHKNAFDEKFYKKFYIVKPVSDTRKIEFTWILPSLLEEYRTKPHHYLAFLFGYEGEGSLCAYLRKRLWAIEMVAGTDDSGFEYNSMYCLFNVCVYLTEEGLEHLDEVISATFSYIKLFEKEGPNESVFEELKSIEATTFRFQNERSAFDNVQDLVLNLKYFPSQDVLAGPELYFEFNANSIWRLINLMTHEFNFNIMLTCQNEYDGISFNKVEKWFGTQYAEIDMPQKWIDLWNKSELMCDLHYPKKNVFITNNFDILCKDRESERQNQYPKKLMDNNLCELYFKQDDKFLLPEAFMYFYFISPLPSENAKNGALMTLASHLIKFNLVEELYPATVAGLNYELYSSDKGLVLKVSGFNEKLPLIVDIITKRMKNTWEKINDEQFNTYVKHQQHDYYNSLIKPKSLNKDIRLQIVENSRWPMYEKHNLLKDLALTETKTFMKELFNQIKIQGIIQGNVNEETAHNVMNTILNNLNCSAIKNQSVIDSRTCQLPIGSNYILCQSLNENNANSVVCNFYQIGPCTLYIECLLDLLLMFLEEPLFDCLRTKEQLGYDVSATVRNNFGILGYSITVNSQEDKFKCSYVDDRIEVFRSTFGQLLRNMDIEEFNRTKESLIKTKQIVDNELREEISRNWGEITCNEYVFDRLKREIECLKKITKEDVLSFCFNSEKNNFRKLSVQVVGNLNANNDLKVKNDDSSKSPTKEGISLKFIQDEKSTITDIHEFKQNLFVYPVSKTVLDSNFSGTENKEQLIIYNGNQSNGI